MQHGCCIAATRLKVLPLRHAPLESDLFQIICENY